MARHWRTGESNIIHRLESLATDLFLVPKLNLGTRNICAQGAPYIFPVGYALRPNPKAARG